MTDWSRIAILGVVLIAVATPNIVSTFVLLLRSASSSSLSIPKKVGLLYILPNAPNEVDERSRGGNVHISICGAKHFKNVAASTKEMLEHHFPEKQILLSIYKPPENRVILSNLVSGLQGILWLSTWIGTDALASFGVSSPPAFLLWMKQNKIISIALVWVAGAQAKSQLMTTDAFEVFYDGHRIFSGLAERRVPTIQELRSILSENPTI